jgi:hypothetical protein
MDKKHEKMVQSVALIAVGLITYGVATYLIVKIVVALNALSTVPPQLKKLPEARAVGSGQAWLCSHCAASRLAVKGRLIPTTEKARDIARDRRDAIC